MTPREVLTLIGGSGFQLCLRPGGLRLSGKGELPPEVITLIRDHRKGLIAVLEGIAQSWVAHETSLASNRVVNVPPHVVPFIHPSLRPFGTS